MSDASVLAALADPDALRRQAAIEELAATGAPLDGALISALVAVLATPRKPVQRLAADLLARVAPSERPAVLARLRTALESSDGAERWGATYALGRLGIVEPAMIAPLLAALAEADGDVRWAAADLLTTCARVHRDWVLDALLAAASDREPERRKMALYVLRDVAPELPAAHDAVTRGLADSAVGVRFAALSALPRLVPVPEDACRSVLMLVRDDPDAGFRRPALCALGDLGRGVSAVDAALAVAAASDDPGMRRAARVARRRLERQASS